jgi:hypothetical protein
MGRILMRVLEEAGLLDVTERALLGAGLAEPDLARLRGADLLLVAGLADLVRNKFHGNEVCIVTSAGLRDPSVVTVEAAPALADGPTGADFLVEVALARLKAPGTRSLGVSFDSVGLELAQTALVFGADMLFGELAGKRTLPLLDGPEARRAEIAGLCERAGRTVRFLDPAPRHAVEQRS